jgi:hypothetical protein
MAIRIVSFLALLFSALALVPYGAHLFALPNKIGMRRSIISLPRTPIADGHRLA